MDEPFGALDAMTRQGLQDEVLSLVAASGATVIFVTHDLDEAIYLGDRVIGLLPHPGRIGIELAGQPAAPARPVVDPRASGIPAAAAAIVRLHQGDRAVTANPPSAKALVLPLAVLLAFEVWARATHLQSDSLAPPSEIVMALARRLRRSLDPGGDPRHAVLGLCRPCDRHHHRPGARHRLRHFRHAQPPDGSDGRGDPADPLDRAAADRADRARLRLPHGNRHRGLCLRLADPDPDAARRCAASSRG